MSKNEREGSNGKYKILKQGEPLRLPVFRNKAIAWQGFYNPDFILFCTEHTIEPHTRIEIYRLGDFWGVLKK